MMGSTYSHEEKQLSYLPERVDKNLFKSLERSDLQNIITLPSANIDSKIWAVKFLTPYNQIPLIDKFELEMVNYINFTNVTPNEKCGKINDYDDLVLKANYPRLLERMLDYQYSCICEFYYESYNLAQRTNDFNVMVSSANVLLRITHIQQDRWRIISDNLVRLFNDPQTPHGRKSDIADLLIRTRGCDAATLTIIKTWLGPRFNPNTRNVQVVYNSGQNVHTTGLTQSTRRTLEKFGKDKIDESDENYGTPYKTIDSIRALFVDNIEISNALDRIRIDTATFHYGFRLRDIIQHIYFRIYHHKEKDELIKRLGEELVDASHYCATGYLTRLINVLSAYDDDVAGGFGYDEEIYATLTKRFTDLIQKNEDAEAIMDSFTQTVTDNRAQDFFDTIIEKLFVEIFKEYKGIVDMDVDYFCTLLQKSASKLSLHMDFVKIMNSEYLREYLREYLAEKRRE